MPNITLGLINGTVRMSVEHGVTEWFAVMEPSLLRLLAKYGIYFSPIGPMVNYHGMRQPCYVIFEKMLGRVRKERIDVWEFITENGRLLDRGDLPFASFRLNN
jgi:N-acyl amino acid synthase of PEP-CTERM/exosortase system